MCGPSISDPYYYQSSGNYQANADCYFRAQESWNNAAEEQRRQQERWREEDSRRQGESRRQADTYKSSNWEEQSSLYRRNITKETPDSDNSPPSLFLTNLLISNNFNYDLDSNPMFNLFPQESQENPYIFTLPPQTYQDKIKETWDNAKAYIEGRCSHFECTIS